MSACCCATSWRVSSSWCWVCCCWASNNCCCCSSRCFCINACWSWRTVWYGLRTTAGLIVGWVCCCCCNTICGWVNSVCRFWLLLVERDVGCGIGAHVALRCLWSAFARFIVLFQFVLVFVIVSILCALSVLTSVFFPIFVLFIFSCSFFSFFSFFFCLRSLLSSLVSLGCLSFFFFFLVGVSVSVVICEDWDDWDELRSDKAEMSILESLGILSFSTFNFNFLFGFLLSVSSTERFCFPDADFPINCLGVEVVTTVFVDLTVTEFEDFVIIGFGAATIFELIVDRTEFKEETFEATKVVAPTEPFRFELKALLTNVLALVGTTCAVALISFISFWLETITVLVFDTTSLDLAGLVLESAGISSSTESSTSDKSPSSTPASNSFSISSSFFNFLLSAFSPSFSFLMFWFWLGSFSFFTFLFWIGSDSSSFFPFLFWTGAGGAKTFIFANGDCIESKANVSTFLVTLDGISNTEKVVTADGNCALEFVDEDLSKLLAVEDGWAFKIGGFSSDISPFCWNCLIISFVGFSIIVFTWFTKSCGLTSVKHFTCSLKMSLVSPFTLSVSLFTGLLIKLNNFEANFDRNSVPFCAFSSLFSFGSFTGIFETNGSDEISTSFFKAANSSSFFFSASLRSCSAFSLASFSAFSLASFSAFSTASFSAFSLASFSAFSFSCFWRSSFSLSSFSLCSFSSRSFSSCFKWSRFSFSDSMECKVVPSCKEINFLYIPFSVSIMVTLLGFPSSVASSFLFTVGLSTDTPNRYCFCSSFTFSFPCNCCLCLSSTCFRASPKSSKSPNHWSRSPRSINVGLILSVGPNGIGGGNSGGPNG